MEVLTGTDHRGGLVNQGREGRKPAAETGGQNQAGLRREHPPPSREARDDADDEGSENIRRQGPERPLERELPRGDTEAEARDRAGETADPY